MQNPTKYLNLVAELIAQRPTNYMNALHLCHFEGKLQLLRSKHSDTPHTVFMQITKRDIEEGLTPAAWHGLGTRLSNFYGVRNQCPDPSRQSVSKNPKNCSTSSSTETS